MEPNDNEAPRTIEIKVSDLMKNLSIERTNIIFAVKEVLLFSL